MTEKELPREIKGALTKSEAEIAGELKQRFAEAMTPALQVMEEARSLGFELSWQAVGPTPPDGRCRIINLLVIKTKVY